MAIITITIASSKEAQIHIRKGNKCALCIWLSPSNSFYALPTKFHLKVGGWQINADNCLVQQNMLSIRCLISILFRLDGIFDL